MPCPGVGGLERGREGGLVGGGWSGGGAAATWVGAIGVGEAGGVS